MIEEKFFGVGESRSQLIKKIRDFNESYRYKISLGRDKHYLIEVGVLQKQNDLEFMALIGESFSKPSTFGAVSGSLSHDEFKNKNKLTDEVINVRSKDEKIYNMTTNNYPAYYPGLPEARYGGEFHINVYKVTNRVGWAEDDKKHGFPEVYANWELGRKCVASILQFIAEYDLLKKGFSQLDAFKGEERESFEIYFEDMEPFVFKVDSHYVDGEYRHGMILPGVCLDESFRQEAMEAKKGDITNWPVTDISEYNIYGVEFYKIKEPIKEYEYTPGTFRDYLHF